VEEVEEEEARLEAGKLVEAAFSQGSARRAPGELEKRRARRVAI
jgi:hypothetical protein